jgi:hypothetical protein
MERIHIPAEIRRLVLSRAQSCCEYCLLHQEATDFTHPVDHVIAVKHKGQTSLENLALACLECNVNKGADIATFDPLTDELTPLFNPRRHNWFEHFALIGDTIEGLTPVGRATAELLQFNVPMRKTERAHLLEIGAYSPRLPIQ